MAFTQQQLVSSPYLVGPLQKTVVLNAEVTRDLTDDEWLNQQISASEGWDLYVAGKNELTELGEWRGRVRTPEVLDDGHVYVGWSEYWASIITLRSLGNEGDLGWGDKSSKGGDLGLGDSFGFASLAKSGVGADTPCVPLSSLAKKGITAQLGMLQDDILYNLSLLCKNVLEPLKAKYPNIIIVSGFRQVNTGIGQHERGEAVDITIPSATDALLYEVADYIAKSLQFDQVILNYSMRRSSWIHVSFSSTGLRRTALTRDFDDTFHRGLFLITEKTGEDRAAAIREQGEYLDKIDAELKIAEKRHIALNPQTVIGDATSDDMGSGDILDDHDCGEPDDTVPNMMGTVQAVFDAKQSDGSEWDLTTEAGGGDFTAAVVNALPGEWGHFKKHPGQTQHNGHAVDAIAYLSPTPLYNGKYVQGVDIVGAIGSADAEPHWLPLCAPVGDTPDGRDLDPNDYWYK